MKFSGSELVLLETASQASPLPLTRQPARAGPGPNFSSSLRSSIDIGGYIINAAEATAEEEFMSDHGMDKVGFLTLQQGCVDSSLDRMLKTKTQGSSLH